MGADPYPGWSPNSQHPPGRDRERSYWSDYHRYRKQDYYGERKGGNPFEEWARGGDDDPFVDESSQSSKDAWSFLGINKTDDESIIRKAYYTLAREYHPDRGGDKADMAKLNNAYEYAMRFV